MDASPIPPVRALDSDADASEPDATRVPTDPVGIDSLLGAIVESSVTITGSAAAAAPSVERDSSHAPPTEARERSSVVAKGDVTPRAHHGDAPNPAAHARAGGVTVPPPNPVERQTTTGCDGDDVPPSPIAGADPCADHAGAPTTPSPIKLLFKDGGKKISIVVAALIGVPQFTAADDKFLSKAKVNKSDYFPPKPLLQNEVTRRCAFNDAEDQKCKSWDKPKLTKWLEQNIVKSILENNAALAIHAAWINSKEAFVDSRRTDVSLKLLRVIEVAFDERLREKFIRRHAKKKRRQIDSRKSESRETTFYEDGAELFNSEYEDYETVLYSPSDWICDIFTVTIVLPHPTGPRQLNAQSFKDVLTDLRAKVIQVIKNWSKSGNGDGNLIDGDEQHFSGNTQMNFVTGMGFDPAVAYYWRRADELGILDSVTQELGDSHGGSSDKPTRKIGKWAKKKRRTSSDGDSDDDFGLRGMQSSFLKNMASIANLAAGQRSKREDTEIKVENLRADKIAAQKNFSDVSSTYSEMVIRVASADVSTKELLANVLEDQKANVEAAKKGVDDIGELLEQMTVELTELVRTENEQRRKPKSNKRKSNNISSDDEDAFDEDDLKSIDPEAEVPHKDSEEINV